MENANSIEVTENLIQKLRNSDAAIRNDAIKTLSARTDIETIRLLLPHLKDRRGDGRFYEDIVSILRRIKNPLKDKVLICAFNDRNPLIRAGVFRILARTPDKPNADAALLRKAFSDRNVEVRRAVIDHVKLRSHYIFGQYLNLKCNDAGYGILKTALQDRNPMIRAEAAAALSVYNIKDKNLAKPALMALWHSDRFDFISRVMEGGIRVLQNIGKPAAGIFIRELSNPDWRIRTVSAAALVPLKDIRVVDPLINALKDPHPDLRNWARAALAEIGAPGIEPLINALKHKDYYTDDGDLYIKDNRIGHITWVLIEIGPPAEKYLLRAVHDNNAHVRSAAAAALGEMRSPTALPLIIEKLRDDNKKVRLNAIIALEKYSDKRAVEPLIASLGEKDVRLRQAAVKALGELHDKKAAPALIRMLNDTDITLKYGERGVTWALGKLHDKQATAPLAELLHDKNLDSDAPVRALGELKDVRAVPALVTALEHPNQNVRSSAAWALGDIKDRRAVKPLIFILRRGSDADISQFNVAQAIGKIGDKTAFKHLIWAAKSKDRELRRGAAAGLAELKGASAKKYLLILSKDEDNRVRKVAEEALRRMKNIPKLPSTSQKYSPDVNALLVQLNSAAFESFKVITARELVEFSHHPKVRKVLLRALKDRDLAIIAGALPFFIRRGYPGSEHLLIQAVQKYSNNRWDTNAYTLRAFLYSGNTKLSSAAFSLARQQGWCLRCDLRWLLRDIFYYPGAGEAGKIYPWGGKEQRGIDVVGNHLNQL